MICSFSLTVCSKGDRSHRRWSHKRTDVLLGQVVFWGLWPTSNGTRPVADDPISVGPAFLAFVGQGGSIQDIHTHVILFTSHIVILAIYRDIDQNDHVRIQQEKMLQNKYFRNK